MRNSLVTCGAVLAVLSLTSGLAHAQSVVVPNNKAAVEGNTDNAWPFNISHFGLSSQRYQQVYDKSQFAALSGPETITAILFRPDYAFGSAFSSTLPSIQIDLSTTSKTPDGLGTTFASNVGADDTVVFNGPLSLSSAFTGPAGGPKDFDIVINLMTPFLYDPTMGNLLLDVHNFSGGFTAQFDADSTVGDSVSRVYTYASGVGAANADFADSIGLVTKFQFASPVPEPGSLALLATGGLPLLGLLRRRRMA